MIRCRVFDSMLRRSVFSLALVCVAGLTSAQTTPTQNTPQSPETANAVTGTRVINFSGGVVDRNVTLNWETVTETGIKEFTIERANASGEFASVGTVAAKGSSKYMFHFKAASPDEQVRLRIIKSNGESRFSVPLNLRAGETAATLEASPNPASGQIQVKGLSFGDQAMLLSATGQSVRSFTAASSTESLNLEGLPAGSYLLQVHSATGDVRPGLRIIKR